jgi:prolyl-tRNA synthetase
MVSWFRRDELYRADGKLNSVLSKKDEFIAGAATTISQIQAALYAEAKSRMDGNIHRNITDLKEFFKNEAGFKGWVEVQWSRPSGEALAKIVEQLKALKITMRNTPIDAAPADGPCFFTGEAAVERVLIGRTY